MSPRSSSKSGKSGVVVDKPGMSVYTVMLILSLIAISAACLLLYNELSGYGDFPWWKAR